MTPSDPSQPLYTIAANILVKDLDAYIKANVPTTFGFQDRALATVPSIAGKCGKDIVDAIEAHLQNTLVPYTPPAV